MSDELSDELEKNWAAFIEAKGQLEFEHFGRTVLLHDGEIIAIYNDSDDAYLIGCEKFGLGNFSTQTIGSDPISLGFYTTYVAPQS